MKNFYKTFEKMKGLKPYIPEMEKIVSEKNIKLKKPIFPRRKKTKHFKKKLEEEMLTYPALRKDRNKSERMCVAPDHLF